MSTGLLLHLEILILINNLIVLSADQTTISIYLWDHDSYKYELEPSLNITISTDGSNPGFLITNVLPGDYNYDGYLDLLIMGQEDPTDQDAANYMRVYMGYSNNTFIPESTVQQPIPLDYYGTMKVDLLGHSFDNSSYISVWKNIFNETNSTLFEVVPMSTNTTDTTTIPNCTLADPHSNAFIDFNGDCLADLFLTCNDSSSLTYQIWINTKGEFQFSQSGDLPEGTGQISFADIDGDGAIDMLFPVCPTNESTCKIHIAYNVQIPLCGSSDTNCRSSQDLCIADDKFHFNLTDSDSNDAYVILDLSSQLPEGEKILTLDTDFKGTLPVPIRIGDYNLDGYPDILVVTYSSSSSHVTLLESFLCTTSYCDQAAVTAKRRTFKQVSDGASALILKSDSGSSRKIQMIANNYFVDAFFLKALIAQYPQSAYHALITPYSLFGLGRTNNYIELFFAGSTRNQTSHYTTYSGVIPNSQLIIVPYQPPDVYDTSTWSLELYIHPGVWVPWVLLVLVISTIVMVDSKYYKLDDKTILSVKIPQDVITKWFEGKRRKISLFICLDISGSMCGPPLSQAKTAILKLLEELFSREILIEKDVTCMFFDTACDVVRFADDPNMLWKNGAIRSYFDTVNVRGGTQFACVFNSIIDNLKKIGGDSDLAIIFFTDGLSSHGEEFEQSKSKLSKSLLETSFKTEIHTCGSKEGNFQYVESSEDIPGTMETTLGLLEISDKNLYLKIGDNQILQTYFDNEGLGTIVLTGDLETKIDKITILKDNQIVDIADADKYEISLPPRQIFNDDPTSVLMLIPFIQIEITRLSNEIINDDDNQEIEKKQKFNEITKLANKYEDQLNVILQNTYKSRTAMRRTIIQQIFEVKSTINHFKSILSEALKGTLTNEKIASFNNIAYKNITKQRLRTKLDNRAVKNIDKMEDIEKKIMQTVDSMDFDQMEKEETEENLTTFICSLSTDNYIEAMKEGECICLTLDISRSQAAIADPSQIKINKINQSLLSSTAFFDSVKYALDQGNVSAEEIHGGFRLDIVGAKAVEGMARESITGILPLYINEKHWSIAKEKMKPILGYMTTLDIFGYSYSQITTVPFLILSKALSDTSTEFRRRQFKLIFETCDAIYKQSNYLHDDNKKLFEDYLKSPLNRTIDIVPNCMVYLGHLLCALKCKDVNLPDLQRWLNDGLIEYLIEETIRRKFNKLKSSEIIKEMDVSKVFRIDKKKYIEDPVDEFKINYEEYFKALLNSDKSSNLRYSNAAKLALLQENLAEISNLNLADSNVIDSKENSEESMVPPNIKIQLYDPETFRVSNFIIEKIKDIVVESVEIILRFKKIFEYLIDNNDNNDSMDSMFESLLKKQEFHFFEDQSTLANSFFGKYSPKTLLATFFQSYQHRQNHERRNAIISESNKSKYFDPFSDKTAESIIEFYFNEYINTNLQIKSLEIVKGYENEKENAIGLLFWNLKTEEEAAGLLLTDVKYRGHKLFGQVLKALQRNSLNSPKEKIMMVLKGKWKGIRLFFDEPKNPEDPERLARFISNDDWHPSRRTIYRIMKAQRNQIPQIEWWIELFPKYKEYFELQFNDELIRKILNEKYEARQEKRKNNLKSSS
ncbi:7226_t:CDS:10 [Diversispora eburnea]|uniref:7226_t:CDS:1 n=3 Tax=Diversisporales TaxID=214509 RepID=A0A9N9G0P5_9GLOM|nr:7226_t:CDS:10 [Diversispora eburnea]